jgi:hypothetical protein
MSREELRAVQDFVEQQLHHHPFQIGDKVRNRYAPEAHGIIIRSHKSVGKKPRYYSVSFNGNLNYVYVDFENLELDK